MYMKFVLLRKTKKTNLQTYFHLSSLNHLKYAHVLYNAENKKKSAKGSNFKDDGSALPL